MTKFTYEKDESPPEWWFTYDDTDNDLPEPNFKTESSLGFEGEGAKLRVWLVSNNDQKVTILEATTSGGWQSDYTSYFVTPGHLNEKSIRKLWRQIMSDISARNDGDKE